MPRLRVPIALVLALAGATPGCGRDGAASPATPHPVRPAAVAADTCDDHDHHHEHGAPVPAAPATDARPSARPGPSPACCEGHDGQDGHDDHEHGRPAPEAGGSARERDHGHDDGHDRNDDHDDHGHGGGSDLDRPVGELLAAVCEHRIPTHACDECRYEVGVARAGPELFAGGLLRRARVEHRRLDGARTLTGELRFDERRVVPIRPRSSGIVTRVLVALGDRVREGQRLVEIEAAESGEAVAAYLGAQGSLRAAQASAQRLRTLQADGVVARRDLEQAEREADAARATLRAARERLVTLSWAAADIDALDRGERVDATARTTLRAPQGGTVLFLRVTPGETVDPGAELLVIGDASRLWALADVYERDLSVIAGRNAGEGLTATIEVRAYPDRRFPARVEWLSPSVDDATRTVKLRLAVPNDEGLLRSGMFARVHLAPETPRDVLAVPEAAVLADEGRSFVFIHARDDYWIRRPVRRGASWSGWVEIAGGLAGGETVVTEGAFLLKSDVLRSKMGAGCAD